MRNVFLFVRFVFQINYFNVYGNHISYRIVAP